MNLREQFEKWYRTQNKVFQDTFNKAEKGERDRYYYDRVESGWQGFQSGHAAGLEVQERFITLLTQARNRCIVENARLAKRVAELDPANCHPMRLNATMKEPK